MAKKDISRRDALKIMGATAGGLALASCAPAAATPAPTEAPALPTLPPQASPTPGAEMATGATAADYASGQAAYGWYQEWHPSSTVNLLLWGPPGPDGDPWIKSLKDALGRFQGKYPEIKVTFEPFVWDDLDTKMNAAVAAKKGPDVVFEADREAQFPRNKAVIPIDDVLDPAYIKKHKFYEVRPLADGHLYWVHNSIMGPILYVNNKILAEKGVKAADVPTTWEEFGKFCQQFTKFEGDQMVQAGFSINNYQRYIWNDMMYQQGAKCYKDPKTANIDCKESENAWQMIVDFYDKYKIIDRGFLAFDQGFGTGKAAIAQVWTWFGSTLEGNYPDIDWAPAMYPTFSGKGPYGRFDYDGPSWMVTTMAQGDNQKAAIELFKFSTHEYQYLVERSHTTGLVLVTEPHPDYQKMFDDVAAVANPSQEQRRTQSLAVLSKQFAGGMVFPGEVAAPFDQLWLKMSDAIILNKTPIKEALADYQKQYNDLLSNTNFWITPEG
jgi:ABC-type glycerol-3-phosphate transport system substrate-binding protein